MHVKFLISFNPKIYHFYQRNNDCIITFVVYALLIYTNASCKWEQWRKDEIVTPQKEKNGEKKRQNKTKHL